MGTGFLQKLNQLWNDPGPDKGWSWVVLASSWVVMVSTFGICRTGTAGVYFIEFLTVFGVTRKEACWPFSILGITECIVGLTTGFLVQTLDARKLLLASAVSCTLGLVVCFWARDLLWISLGYGVLFGLGETISSTICIVYINQFFENYVATANGVFLSATPISGFLLPLLVSYLIGIYGLRGGMLITAGIVSHTFITALLLRPRKAAHFPVLDESLRKQRKMASALDIIEEHEELELTQRVGRTRRRISDAMITYKHVLFQPMFYVVTLQSLACINTLVGISLTMVDFAVDSGYSKNEGVLLLTMFSIASLVGRLSCGYVTDRGYVGQKWLSMVSLFFMAAFATLLALVNNFTWLMTVIMMTGLAEGCANTLINLLYKYYTGSRGLSTSVGLRLFTNGLVSFFRPIIAGYFRDILGTYIYFYYILGGLSFISGVLWIFEPLIIRNIKDDLKERET